MQGSQSSLSHKQLEHRKICGTIRLYIGNVAVCIVWPVATDFNKLAGAICIYSHICEVV